MQTKIIPQSILWNLAGQLIPFSVALLAIPTIIHMMGVDRFGILTLLLSFLTYSNLFDFGIGLALTHLLSEKLESKASDRDIASFIWTSLSLLLVLGFGGALIATPLSYWLTQSVFQIPCTLKPETLNSFLLFSASIPIVVISLGLRSILQAYQRFDLINTIQIPIGMLNFSIPLFVLLFSSNLFPISCALIGVQAFACWLYIIFLFRVTPFLHHNISINTQIIKSLFRFGRWLTISNIIGPFMVYLDRFFLGAMLSVSAVAYYTTPYDVITKLLIIPAAFCGPLFVAFSASYQKDLNYTTHIFIKGIKTVFLILFPVVLIVLTFANEGLQLWLGSDFAYKSSNVLKWLSFGIFINSLAQITINLVIGVSRPDLSAKLHMLELPFYIFALLILIKIFGIEGAAMAWVGRVTVDATALFIMATRLLRLKQGTIWWIISVLLVAFLLFGTTFLLKDNFVKCYSLITFIIVFFIFAWNYMLKLEDRLWIINLTNFNKSN